MAVQEQPINTTAEQQMLTPTRVQQHLLLCCSVALLFLN
jgi:hypothetical protein